MCVSPGALAEVARELGHHMVPYAPKLLPIILRELRCEMSDNRRNSAFAAGTLVAAAPEATSQHALNLLQVSFQHEDIHHAMLAKHATDDLEPCTLPSRVKGGTQHRGM